MATVKFKNRRVNMTKLSQFGFEPNEAGDYQYRVSIMQGQFELTIVLQDDDGRLATALTDAVTGEAYVLHLTSHAQGQFVGQVAQAYHDILRQVERECYDNDVFGTKQERTLIANVHDLYGDQLEFLWAKFPKNAVWRRTDTHKWYGALLTVASDKLALPGAGQLVTVLDLRAQPDDLVALIDGRHYLPGYHMNKKHWYSIVLDGTVATSTIMTQIQASYELAK